MSCTSFEKHNNGAVGRLPTLQEVLRCCDENVLASTVIDEFAVCDWLPDQPSLKRRRSMKRRLCSTLASMRTLAIKRKRGRHRLLLPVESFVLHEGSGLIERRVGARMLCACDVSAARRMLDKGIRESGCGGGLPMRSFSLEPWDIVLASRVWFEGSWCTRERYLMLASALWEMTVHGFEYDGVVVAQAHVKAQCAANATTCDTYIPATVPQLCKTQVVQFGLEIPDLYAREYQDALAARVDELNRCAQLDVCRRLIDATAPTRTEAA